MGTFVNILIVLALLWTAYFAYQVVIGKRLRQPLVKNVGAHPAAVIQQGIAAGSGRGFSPSVDGSSVVVTHQPTKSQIVFAVVEQNAGTHLTASIRNVRKGSFAMIPTNRSALALLRKRDEVLARLA